MRLEYFVIQSINQEEKRLLSYLVRLGAVQLIIWTPIFYLLPFYFDLFKKNHISSQTLSLVPITAYLISLSFAVAQKIQKNGDFKTTSIAEVYGKLSYAATAVVGSLALPSTIGLISSSAASSLCKLAYLKKRINIKSLFTINQRDCSVTDKTFWMGLSLSGSNILNMAGTLVTSIVVLNNYGSSEMGQYSLVLTTLYLPMNLIGQAVGQIFHQRSVIHLRTNDSLEELTVKTTKGLILIGIPIFATIALFSPQLYPLIFGGEWTEAGTLARFMSLQALAGFISSPMDRTSMVVRIWWWLPIWNIFRLTTTFFAVWIGHYYDFNFHTFVFLVSFQGTIMYALDWIVTMYFSKIKIGNPS